MCRRGRTTAQCFGPAEAEYRAGPHVRRRHARRARSPARTTCRGIRARRDQQLDRERSATAPSSRSIRARVSSAGGSRATDVSSSGVLTTATDLLFTASRDGYFYALDARTGELLWRASLGGQGANGPITYAVDGAQYVAVAAGNALSVFALGD